MKEASLEVERQAAEAQMRKEEADALLEKEQIITDRLLQEETSIPIAQHSAPHPAHGA